MKLDTLLLVLNNIELLKVDAQPVRDLIDRLQEGEDLSYLDHIVDVLLTLLETKKFSNGSTPTQVVFLLSKLLEIQPAHSTVVNKQDTESSEIIGLLSELKQEIQSIKTKVHTNVPTVSTSYRPDEARKTIVEPTPIFINPITKDLDLKGNITIDTKKGDSISNKLNKLKNIKRK